VLRQQALTQQSMSPMEESYNAQIEALEILREVRGARSAEVADTLGNIGNLVGDIGRPDLAVTTLEEALEITAATYGCDNPRYKAALSNLAIAYAQNNQEAKAKQLYADLWGVDAAGITLEFHEPTD
jgi:tetratricopeptide (TPR) repeat protein